MSLRLSICISTRNRSVYLRETLVGILAQSTEQMEVLVLDGASTDDTVQMVRTLQKEHAGLTLVESTTNGGLDADFDRAVLAARGEYCWLFSDDDLIAPGGIREVLDALESEPTVVIVDASVFGPDFSRRYQRKRTTIAGRRTFDTHEGTTFFSECVRHLSFIGGVVVRRSFWMSRERERYFGTYFIHIGVLFQAPIPGTVVVIGEPLVHIRYGMATWTSKAFDIWMYKWPELIWSFDWIPEQARASAIPRLPWTTAKRLLAMRAVGAYGRPEYESIIRPRSTSKGQLVAPLIVAAVPGRFAYAAIRLAAYVRDPHDFIHHALDNSPFRWGPKW